MEHLQVIDAFAETNVSNRNFELVAYANHDAPLSGAVELGDGESVDVGGGFLEF